MVTISVMTEKDTKFAAQLTDKEKWGHADVLEKVLTIGTPEINRKAVAMLVRNGFKYVAPSLRMYCGKRRYYEYNVYGIIAPEKG